MFPRQPLFVIDGAGDEDTIAYRGDAIVQMIEISDQSKGNELWMKVVT
jgi:hypothetical protein